MKSKSKSLPKQTDCVKICGRRNGCTNPQVEDHTCPYSEEINENFESMCNCCDECRQECVYDI